MPPYHYFSSPTFAWLFFLSLVSVLLAAAWTDLRAMIVPKQLTLTALGIGVVLNAIRGALNGASGLPGWVFSHSNATLGVVDGIAFSTAGFALAFALAFSIWFFGAAGGGDVKLFAALGAWIGPYLAFWVLAMSVVVLTAMLFTQVIGRLFTHGLRAAKPGKPKVGKPGKRVMVYSVPFAISTVLVLLWAFRFDLQWLPPTPLTSEVAHARASR